MEAGAPGLGGKNWNLWSQSATSSPVQGDFEEQVGD
jgi:hypothetical protein